MMELRGGTAEKWADMIETAKATLEKNALTILSILQQKGLLNRNCCV